jgi:hypothetical protein
MSRVPNAVTNSPAVTPLTAVLPLKYLVPDDVITWRVMPFQGPDKVMVVPLTLLTRPLSRLSSTTTFFAVGVVWVGSNDTTTFSPMATPSGATGVPGSKKVVVGVVAIVLLVPWRVVMVKLPVPTEVTVPRTRSLWPAMPSWAAAIPSRATTPPPISVSDTPALVTLRLQCDISAS